MRDITDIRADLAAAEAKYNRLGDEILSYADRPLGELSRGDAERFERLERGVSNARVDVDRYKNEWRDAVQRSASRGYVEGGDGAVYDNRDSGAENLRAGLTQYGAPYNRHDEDQIISRAKRAVDKSHREASSAAGDRLHTLLDADRTDEFDPGYVARRTLITQSPIYRSAFFRVLQAQQSMRPAILTNEEAGAIRAYEDMENMYARGHAMYTESVSRAMTENGANSAGLGIPTLIDPSIIITSGAADVPLLRVCDIRSVTTNLWTGISSAGMSWSYDTEGAQVSDDSATLAAPTVRIHMARGFIPYTIEAGIDMVDFQNQMGGLVNQGYTDLLAVKTMTGTGSGEPAGIFVALSNATSVITPTTDGSFGGPDVFKVWNGLPERFRANATWVMSVNVQSAIRQFAASQSSTSAYFSIDLTGGTFRINDRPVIITDYAPTGVGGSVPGTTGLQNILAVSDFRQSYVWANRMGMSIEAIPHLFSTTNNRPTGSRGLFAWSRNGGDVVSTRAGILLQNQ
jgi:HK97 family phage major capsid protein